MIHTHMVNVIIGEMWWDCKDIKRQTQANMMACLGDVADDPKEFPGGKGIEHYRVVIKVQFKFFLFVDYLRVGLSFRQAAQSLLTTKNQSGLTSMGLCSDSKMSRYVSISCDVNLQKVYEILLKAWMFAIAMYMCTHMSTLYLESHVRLHLNSQGIVNVRILAVFYYKRHTTTDRTFDFLYLSLLDTIISISTDSHREMTGLASDFSKRLQNVKKKSLFKSGVVIINLTFYYNKRTRNWATGTYTSRSLLSSRICSTGRIQ